MFEKVLIEKSVLNHHRTKSILEKIKYRKLLEIDDIDDVFNRVKKPYLQKRTNLNLFIGNKKGTLVKEAPSAYGLSGNPHYYFIHAYNCFYECDYCYLQGYFHSPDLVFFINHEDIANEMSEVLKKTPPELTPWFHAGEFSDSLGLSHLSGEIPFYFDYFQKKPNAVLELRTKSANTRELEKQVPLKNIVTTFSMSPEKQIKEHDLKTAPLKARLGSIERLHQKGFPIGIHFDPIIYNDNIITEYQELIEQLNHSIPLKEIEYISLGVVRFTKDVFHQVQKNYPKSSIHGGEFIKSFDGKVRYNRPMRLWLLQKIKDLLVQAGAQADKVYLCMED